MNNQLPNLTKRVEDYLVKNKTAIKNVTDHVSNVFEALCFVTFARHYENIGYQLVPKNLQDGKFRFRYSSNGLPWRFSFFSVRSAKTNNIQPLFEIWHNQKVAGAWVQEKNEELALFAVDVAVTQRDSLPANLKFFETRKDHQYWVSKSDLITFGEAKKLVGYPMLLAQFLGIVHEIKPAYIGASKDDKDILFIQQGHPPPTLMTANHLTAGALGIISTFQSRNFNILVIDNMINRPDKNILEEINSKTKNIATLNFPLKRLIELEEDVRYQEMPSDKEPEFKYIQGSIPILISAPHGAVHKRGDKYKEEDEFTSGFSQLIAELTDAHVIYARRKSTTDPNRYNDSPYKEELTKIIDNAGIKIVIDIHGASADRKFGIALGTADGISCPNEQEEIIKTLGEYGFRPENKNLNRLAINEEGYKAKGAGTVTRYVWDTKRIPAAQFELNAKIRIVERRGDATIKESFKGDLELIKSTIHAFVQLVRILDSLTRQTLE